MNSISLKLPPAPAAAGQSKAADRDSAEEDIVKRTVPTQQLVIPLLQSSSLLGAGHKRGRTEGDDEVRNDRQHRFANATAGDAAGADDVGVESSVYDFVPVSAFGAAMLRGMGVQVSAEDRGTVTAADPHKPAVARHRAFGTAHLGLGAVPASGKASSQPSDGAGTAGSSVKPGPGPGSGAGVSARFPWLHLGGLVWLLPGRSSKGRPTPSSGTATVPEPGCIGVVCDVEGVPGLEKFRARVWAKDVGAQAGQEERATVLIIHAKADSCAADDRVKSDSPSCQELLRAHASSPDKRADEAGADHGQGAEASQGVSVAFAGATVGAGLNSSVSKDSSRYGPSAQPLSTGTTGSAADPGSRSGLLELGWLWPNIRVRVVDERWDGGRWFKAKAVVVDVPGDGTATLRIDEPSGRVVRTGVPASYLQTALPKAQGMVRVLSGKYRGKLGVLLARDSSAGTAQVRTVSDDRIVSVPLDDVAATEDTGSHDA